MIAEAVASGKDIVFESAAEASEAQDTLYRIKADLEKIDKTKDYYEKEENVYKVLSNISLAFSILRGIALFPVVFFLAPLLAWFSH